MLHPFQEASRNRLPYVRPAAEAKPGRQLAALISGINDWLDMTPSVQSRQGKNLYILYRHAAVLLMDFWDNFGRPMARISRTWPLSAFGTAENQETIRLSAAIDGDAVELIQESISGKSTDILRTLCLQIDCGDEETAEKLDALFQSMDWQTGLAALDWKDADLLRSQELLPACDARSFYCYAGIAPQADPAGCLGSLSFSQKIMLWIAFLRDGFEPTEFEWLAGEIAEDALENRMEWELALREAMEPLGFRIVNRDKDFQLYDGQGRRLYFGADGRAAAGRALLKILFPLNYT